MKMKKTVFTLLTLMLLGMLQAAPVDMATAKRLGVRFMNTNTAVKSAQAELVYTGYADNGQACFYVFTMQPKGFVIVSADDRAKPILGYSVEGAFSDDIPEGLESFFQNYRAGFSQLMASNEPQTAEAADDWQRLETTGRINRERITREVPQLLTCKWNQSALYNRRCPEDENGPDGHVYAGCVATAMSQIMYYWQWPHRGNGAYIYTIWEYGQIAASFEDTHYSYELMPDFLDWTSTEEEIDAVALLQFHAGVSVEMGYSPEGSGAFSERVANAMANHFYYSSEMEHYYRVHFDDAVWDNMLRENLDLGEPLYYSASGADGGHAFVCDGYDQNDMFHFNWGWQGLDNGYYAINGLYLSHYAFPNGHSAIFGIAPDTYQQCYSPEACKDVQITPVAEGTNRITLTAPAVTMAEWDIEQLDSIVIMRNNEVVHTEYNVPGAAQVSYDDTDALGIGHYSVYAFVGDLQNYTVKDTVMNGPTCDLNFHLHDSVGDGWITSAISIVDSRGNAIHRIGLAEGSDAEVKVEVPASEEVYVHWAYTIGGKDHECYFEVYDWDGRLVYATEDKPEIGELCSLYVDCSDAVEEQAEETLTVYPNPTDAVIRIEGVEVALVEVYNTMGQLVMRANTPVVDLSGLEPGAYFIRVVDTYGSVSVVKSLKR